jgi:hypothetical protein
MEGGNSEEGGKRKDEGRRRKEGLSSEEVEECLGSALTE